MFSSVFKPAKASDCVADWSSESGRKKQVLCKYLKFEVGEEVWLLVITVMFVNLLVEEILLA